MNTATNNEAYGGLRSMRPGKRYLAGDSLGYDLVDCIDVMPQHEIAPGEIVYAVKVRYTETGTEDLFFEAAGYGSNLYVEER